MARVGVREGIGKASLNFTFIAHPSRLLPPQGDGVDDRDEIQSTIDEAASRGMDVWVPVGEYNVGEEGKIENPGNVAVLGAGMVGSSDQRIDGSTDQ